MADVATFDDLLKAEGQQRAAATPDTTTAITPTTSTPAPTGPGRGDGVSNFKDLQSKSQPPGKSITDYLPTADTINDFMRPGVADVVGTGWGAMANQVLGKKPLSLPGLAVGAATGLTMDVAMQLLRNKPPMGFMEQAAGFTPNTLPAALLNATEEMVPNYFMQKFGRGIFNVGRQAIQGNVIDPMLVKFGGTFSQLTDPDSWWSRGARTLEDIAARGRKIGRQISGAQAGYDITADEAASYAGLSRQTVGSPQYQTQLIRNAAINAKDQLDTAFKSHMLEYENYSPKYEMRQPTGANGKPLLGPNGQPLPPVRTQVNGNFDPLKAADALNNANGVDKIRQGLFNKNGLAQLASDPDNSAIPVIDRLLTDSQQVQRVVDSGNLKIPGTNITISDKVQKGLQGYWLQSALDKAASRNPKTGAIFHVDPKVFMDQLTDPKMQESLSNLFGPKQLDYMKDIAKAFGRTQETLMNGLSTNAKMTLGADGIYLGTKLITEGTKGITFPLIPIAMRVGGGAAASMLTNPTLSELMAAAVSGEPLGAITGAMNHAIADALDGTIVTVVTKDGQRVRGEIKDKTFHPLASQTPELPGTTSTNFSSTK